MLRSRAILERGPARAAVGAVLVAGALLVLPASFGLVSPRPRRAIEPPGARVTPELEPPPSRLVAPRSQGADGTPSTHDRRESARWAEDAAGAQRAPSTASTERAPEPARLAVLVHGLPAGEGASLELLHEPAQGPARRTRHVSDAQGHLTLVLAPGSVRLVAWSEHATARPVSAELAAGSSAAVELALEPALPVLGRVLDARTGAPLAGASVSLWTFAEEDVVTTGPDGSFRHPRFPARAPAQQIAARARGYGTSVRCLRIGEDGAWKLSARHAGESSLRGSGTPWIELELVPELVVRGRAVDASGAPLAGAHVTIEGFQRVLPSVASRDAAAAECGADGSFELGGLRSDLGHALTLEAPGLTCEPLELAATSGVLELGALVLAPATFLSGVVLDPAGVPVAEAEVVLRLAGAEPVRSAALDAGARVGSHERRAVTGPEGTFLFEGLWAARVSLAVETEQGDTAQALLEPRADGSFDPSCLTLAPPLAVLRSR